MNFFKMFIVALTLSSALALPACCKKKCEKSCSDKKHGRKHHDKKRTSRTMKKCKKCKHCPCDCK